MAEENACYSSDTKKAISSSACVIAALIAIGLVIGPVQSLLLVMLHFDATARDRREFFHAASMYKLLLSALLPLTVSVVTGYDNMTGYRKRAIYSEFSLQ